jgi:hypothetical protein
MSKILIMFQFIILVAVFTVASANNAYSKTPVYSAPSYKSPTYSASTYSAPEEYVSAIFLAGWT